MTAPRFGVGFRANRDPADYERIGRLAEDLGFDVVSVFADLGDEPPLGALLSVASATKRVSLGPACMNPYTTHPVEIAGSIAVLDRAAGGRAYLGLARGAWLDAIGVAQPRPVRTLNEAATIVRLLLARDRGGYAGEIFRLSPGFVLERAAPRSEVPLLIGGWGAATVALAGEIAAELKVGGSANPDMVGVIRQRLAVGARRAGRPADATAVVLGAVTVVDEDGSAARRFARTAVARYFEVVCSLDPTITLPPGLKEALQTRLARGDVEGAGDMIPDALMDRFSFAGTPKQVSRQVDEILARGASRIEFGAPFGLDGVGGLRIIGERVLPLFR